MAEHFRSLQLYEFVQKHLEQNSRADGRTFHQDRDLILDSGGITTADASSIIKLGATTVVCGVTVSLIDREPIEKQFEQQNQVRPTVLYDMKSSVTPTTAADQTAETSVKYRLPVGQLKSLLLDVQVKVKPYSTYAIRMDGRDGECKENALLASQVKHLILESQLFHDEHFEAAGDSERLLQYEIEAMILNHDGNVLDACWIALLTAATKFQTPIELKDICRFRLTQHPVCSTFALIRTKDRLVSLLDPTLEEQQLADGLCSFAINPDTEQLLFTNLQLICPGLDDHSFLELVGKATERAKQIKCKLLNF
jgi:exosome complex RNA-binding protein Rrp42 (RNase PH superfamily)